METKEREFGGTVLNGFLFLFINIVLTLASIASTIYGIVLLTDDNYSGSMGGWLVALGLVVIVASLIMWSGMMMLAKLTNVSTMLINRNRNPFRTVPPNSLSFVSITMNYYNIKMILQI